MKKSDFNELNQRQKEFYEHKKKNIVTKFWYSLRNGILRNIRKDIGIEKELQLLHINWVGDITEKKVLDLGCYEGNAMSMYLAKNSKEYIAIDLSEKGISHLQRRIKDFSTARAITMDFLSDNFDEKDFDLIYAYGVLHHFKDTDLIIKRLNDKLSDKGIIISNDPLETSFILKFVRLLYRPFQSDKDWEWPFSKQTFFRYKKAFDIIERRGMLGKAKWGFLVNLLPYTDIKKTEILKKWHREDWNNSKISDSSLFNCMHVTLLMQKKVNYNDSIEILKSKS